MKKTALFITLLTVFGCVYHDVPKPKNCIKMDISPANPIQFYLNGQESYNEQVSHGGMIDQFCFFQEFECDDELTFQFLEPAGGDFSMKVTDENDNVLAESLIYKTVDLGNDIFPPLGGFVNEGLGQAWTVGDDLSVELAPSQSAKQVYSFVDYAPGYYTVTVFSTIPTGGIEARLRFYSGPGLIEELDLSNGGSSFEIHLTEEIDRVAFNATNPGATTEEIQIIFGEIKSRTNRYEGSFVPGDNGVCEQKIRIGIYSNENDSLFTESLNRWTNQDIGLGAWDTGVNSPTVVVQGAGGSFTDALTGIVEALADTGTYTFNYDVSVPVAAEINELYINVKFYKDGVLCGSTFQNIGTGKHMIGSVDVTSTDRPNSMTIQFKRTTSNPDYTLKLNSFKPEPSLGQQIKARTDLIRISNSIAENVSVYYKGIKDYAGLVWPDGSDYRFIRIPGVFFKPKKKAVVSGMELSNSRFITTSSVLLKKRLFSIQDCPEDFHDKYELIFNHAAIGSVQINALEWDRDAGDDYAILDDDRPDTYPMAPAEVTLTRRNWTKRNVI